MTNKKYSENDISATKSNYYWLGFVVGAVSIGLIIVLLIASAQSSHTSELGNAICQEQNVYEDYGFSEEVLNNDSILKPLPSLIQEYEFDTYSDGVLKCKPVEAIKEVEYDGIKIQIKGDPK